MLSIQRYARCIVHTSSKGLVASDTPSSSRNLALRLKDSIKDYRFLSVLHRWTIPVHIDQTSRTRTRQQYQLICFIKPPSLSVVFPFDSKAIPPIVKDC